MKRFLLGLSSGKAEGHATLALVETFGEYRINKRYNLRRVEQIKFKSDDDVVDRIIEFLGSCYARENANLISDITVCGQKSISSLTEASLNLVAVTMVDEGTATSGDGGYVLSKKELLTNLQLLYVAERFRVNPQLPLADFLIEEILGFRAHKTPQNHERCKAGIGQNYYDIIFAVALVCWYGQEVSKKEIQLPGPDST